MKTAPLYETEALRSVTGAAIRPGGLALTERAATWCAFAAGVRVLDVGCGLGETVGHLGRAYHLRAVGLDASALLLGEGRLADPDRPLVRGLAQDLPFASGVFKGLFCECVLSLMADPGAVLAEFHRVLAEDGLLVITDLYLRQGRTGLTRLPGAGCLEGALTRDELAGLIKAAGFSQQLWEDHSPLLKELAARLVWAHGSAAALGFGNCSGPGTGLGQKSSQGRPGYFLMVAQKEKRHE